MRNVLVLSIGILLCASAVYGQAGYIGMYEDVTYLDCFFDDTSPGLKHVYVVHKYAAGATASQWMLENYGMACTYLAEYSPFITIGDAFNGISVAYGGCFFSDILLLDISYFCEGLSPVCAAIYVVPDPAAPTGEIEVVNCSATKLIGRAEWLMVNPNDGCNYCVSAVQETSWGQLKALYR